MSRLNQSFAAAPYVGSPGVKTVQPSELRKHWGGLAYRVRDIEAVVAMSLIGRTGKSTCGRSLDTYSKPGLEPGLAQPQDRFTSGRIF
jgi:hypothetical protein